MTPPISSQTSKHIRYLGTRPKNDQDNPCREKLCQYLKNMGCFYEIYPERFYMIYLAKGEQISSFLKVVKDDPECPFVWWTGLGERPIVYDPFSMDFGPHNLAQTHQFCSRMKVWFDTYTYRNPDKVVAVVLDDSCTEKKLNMTLLVAITAMVLLKMTDTEVIQRLKFFMMYQVRPGTPNKQLIFREKKKFSDVSGVRSMMILGLEDCIRAFYAALQCKFYDFYEFDHAEYLFYETVMSGDLNWIIPGKIVAFAGPSDHKSFNKRPPKFYYHYFKDHNVSSIVRLNDIEYDAQDFVDMGFQHHDLIFPDGFPPTSPIASKFIKIVDEAPGAVAVHCYAGIGRTGTLIAAYLVARYNFTPQMAVAWTRICRPGSVIGDQQDWLYTRFDSSSVDKGCSTPTKPVKARRSENARIPSSTDTPQVIPEPDVSTCPPTPVARPQTRTTYAQAEKRLGQARALQLAKSKRENADRPCTRSHLMKASSMEVDTSATGDVVMSTTPSSPVAKQAVGDVILDLGKTVPQNIDSEEFLPLEGRENPKVYSFHDGKYKWKIKFPPPGYVELRYNYLAHRQPDASAFPPVGEPHLYFKYERLTPAEPPQQRHPADVKPPIDVTRIPKLKPIVYYSVMVPTDI